MLKVDKALVSKKEFLNVIDAYYVEYGGMDKDYKGEIKKEVLELSFCFDNGEVHELQNDTFSDLVFTNTYRMHYVDYERATPTCTFSAEDFAVRIDKSNLEEIHHTRELLGADITLRELMEQDIRWVDFYLRNYGDPGSYALLRCSADVNCDGRCKQIVKYDEEGNMYLVISNKPFEDFFSITA